MRSLFDGNTLVFCVISAIVGGLVASYALPAATSSPRSRRKKTRDENNKSPSPRPYQHEERMAQRVAAASISADSRPRDSVTVRVPATSANIGSGYDCLGMCVDLWTSVTVERSEEFGIFAEGEGAGD